MTQREFFCKAVLALASSGKYHNSEKDEFYPHSLVRDALDLLDEVETTDPSKIDGYNDPILSDIGMEDYVRGIDKNIARITGSKPVASAK